jgi:hypothetical protein
MTNLILRSVAFWECINIPTNVIDSLLFHMKKQMQEQLCDYYRLSAW